MLAREKNCLAIVMVEGEWLIEKVKLRDEIVHAFRILLQEMGNWRLSASDMTLGRCRGSKNGGPFH